MSKKLKNIVYFMHVPWGWIKQRPHFIAEGLSEKYNVTVICEKNKNHNYEKNTQYSNINIINYFDIEFLKKFRITSLLNFIIRKYLLFFRIRNADIIWLTYPAQYNYIKNIYSKKQNIIYDCMDDMSEFFKDDTIIEKIKLNERKICEISKTIITSSEYLKQKIIIKYSINKNIYVINNAIKSFEKISENVELPNNIKQYFENNFVKIIYIGTISNWFDFKLIEKCISTFPNTMFYLVGPTDIEIPNLNNIIKIGPVQHNLVFEIMKFADALIMPFIVNELIKSVNPVKIYEYIYSNKPVIVSKYEETLQFEDYVYLYENKNDFFNLLYLLENKKLYPKKKKNEVFEFLNNNTWKKRIEIIFNLLNDSNNLNNNPN